MSFGLVGKRVAEMLADLFGAQASVQQLLDHCAQLDIDGQLKHR